MLASMSHNEINVSKQQEDILSDVIEEHRQEPHAKMSKVEERLHFTIHAVVETQLANDDPPFVKQALKRLMKEQDLSRHDAIHKIGEVAAKEIIGVLNSEGSYSADRYAAALSRL